jgi:hypothetical protein
VQRAVVATGAHLRYMHGWRQLRPWTHAARGLHVAGAEHSSGLLCVLVHVLNGLARRAW